MFLFEVFVDDKLKTPKNINIIIERIHKGENDLIDDLVNKYRPFILNSVFKITKKFVEVENSDEYSIGLSAFVEAIRCYDINNKKGFLNFCDMVINRRIIDYLRKNKKYKNEIPFSFCENDDKTFEDKYIASDGLNSHIEKKEEILMFKETLKTYRISFKDFTQSIPKHKETKRQYMKIAKLIVENEIIYNKLLKCKNLPISDLSKLLNINRTSLDRNKKFIVSIVIILKSDMDVIKSYVNYMINKVTRF